VTRSRAAEGAAVGDGKALGAEGEDDAEALNPITTPGLPCPDTPRELSPRRSSSYHRGPHACRRLRPRRRLDRLRQPKGRRLCLSRALHSFPSTDSASTPRHCRGHRKDPRGWQASRRPGEVCRRWCRTSQLVRGPIRSRHSSIDSLCSPDRRTPTPPQPAAGRRLPTGKPTIATDRRRPPHTR
jgi:hypothetical protein